MTETNHAKLPKSLPIIYLITSGNISGQRESEILDQLQAAIDAQVDFVQLREKNLDAGALFRLTRTAVEASRGSRTKILVNDRADVAVAAGADGVHLTSGSLRAEVVRSAFGDGLIIGVSTHNLDEIELAREGRADFVTFSPVFETESKRQYGPPQGVESLSEAVAAAGGMPVIALGGIDNDNAGRCFAVGAAGVAGIGMFECPGDIAGTTLKIRKSFSR